jgi:hypothetical protein
MASLDQIIDTTQLLQDVETSQAIQQMDPQSLQRYLQNAQTNLYRDVTQSKDGAIQKAYGDLEQASSTQHAISYYQQRNQDLSNIQGQVYQDRKGNADAVVFDRDLAKRQVEMNQWEASNKMDTLFIYQQLLIILCAVIVMSYLWNKSILSSYVFFGLLFVLVCIFVFTIVNRAQYTNTIRDGRYWSQRLFPTYDMPRLIPTICEPSGQIVQDIESGYDSAVQGIESGYSSAVQSAQSDYNSAVQSVQSDYNSAAQSIQNAYNQL